MRTLQRIAGSLVPKSRVSAALLAVVVTAGVALTVGVSSASIPDSNGVIHACYKVKNGQLYVNDTATSPACKSGRAPLNWSPVNIVAGHHDGFVLLGSATTVATLTIPTAGSYAVWAKVLVLDNGTSASWDTCLLAGPTAANDDSSSVTLNVNTQSAMSLQLVDAFSAGGTVTLSCTNSSSANSQFVSYARITAIPATTLINSAL